MSKCQNCCKQYTCKTTGQNQCESKCINFKSWIYTKNYGEVKEIKDMEVTNEAFKRRI